VLSNWDSAPFHPYTVVMLCVEEACLDTHDHVKHRRFAGIEKVVLKNAPHTRRTYTSSCCVEHTLLALSVQQVTRVSSTDVTHERRIIQEINYMHILLSDKHEILTSPTTDSHTKTAVLPLRPVLVHVPPRMCIYLPWTEAFHFFCLGVSLDYFLNGIILCTCQIYKCPKS